MTDNQMLYTVEDHVATITFNRPEEQNTISGSMLKRFSDLLLQADVMRMCAPLLSLAAAFLRLSDSRRYH